MVESKRKHLAAEDPKSSDNAASEKSSNDSDLLGEDGWIVVKKQRINILIPSLPSIEQSAVPDQEQGQPYKTTLSNIITDTPSEVPQEKPLEEHVAESNDGSISRSLKSDTQFSPKVNSLADNAAATARPMNPDSRRLTVDDQKQASKAFSEKAKNLVKFHKTSPKPVRPFMHSGLSRVCHLSSSSLNFNRNLRALNLEKKISSAGGLDRWLYSLGLEQFVGILGGKSVNKFYLANLSMKKLKDMGAHAVGPRRKLIHAIECVCQPYCCQP